jgi:TonB family protein
MRPYSLLLCICTGLGVAQTPSPKSEARPPGVTEYTIVDARFLHDQLLAHKLPEYPSHLRGARLSGPVVLNTMVDKAGGVMQAEILQSPSRELGEAAAAAVSKWRYRPVVPRHGNAAIVVQARVVLYFNDDGVSPPTVVDPLAK